jgi:hypothetical protein
MRRLLAAVLTLTISLSPIAEAKRPRSDAYTQQAESNEADLESHGHYKNRDGEEVHSPSKSKSGKHPHGASAQCSDGTYSFSRHHRGACSHHGGVAQWLQ